MSATKSVRISEGAFGFLQERAKKDFRSITDTLDFFVSIFMEAEDEELEEKSISSSRRKKMEKQVMA